MAGPSTPGPDEGDWLVEGAGTKSPVNSKIEVAPVSVPSTRARRDRQDGLQPVVVGTVEDAPEWGADGVDSPMMKDTLPPRPDEHCSTENVKAKDGRSPVYFNIPEDRFKIAKQSRESTISADDHRNPWAAAHQIPLFTPRGSPPPLDQLIAKTREQPIKFACVRLREMRVGDVLVATNDFVPGSSDELRLVKGDRVEVMQMADSFGLERVMGRNLRSGKCGLFPETYTRVKVSEALEGSNMPDDSSGGLVEATPINTALPIPPRSCDGEHDGSSDNESVDIQFPEDEKTYRKEGRLRRQEDRPGNRPDQENAASERKERRRRNLLLDRPTGDDWSDIDDWGPGSMPKDDNSSDSGDSASNQGDENSTENKTVAIHEDDEPVNARPSICIFCKKHEDNDPSDGLEIFLTCTVCGNSAHQQCARDNMALEGRQDSKSWRCPEEYTPPGSIYAASHSETGSFKESFGSNASYSAIFSENSRPQPTDPSTRLDSLSVDQIGSRAFPPDLALPSLTKEDVNESKDVEDCSRSISSVADSIGSALSTGGFLGQAGVNYVVAKFTQSDPELLALYTEASQRLTKERFVDNNRRLLKMFYLDFAEEEQTPSQKEALAFLRSRRRRAEISLDILRAVTPDNEVVHLAERDCKEFSMLNAYFETLDAADADTGKNVEEDQIRMDSDGSEVEDGADPPLLDMKSLQAIGEYFVTSWAFSQYKQRLHRFLHPEQKKEDESTGAQGTKSRPADDHGDESREIERGGQPLLSADMDHPFDDHVSETRIRVDDEDYPAEEKSRLGDSQRPPPRPIPAPDHLMPRQRDSLAIWVKKRVTDTLWPPSKGSQRVWYHCGCGEHSYVDVKELEHGGVETERRSISESAAAVRRACAPAENAVPGGQLPEAPRPAHLSSYSPIRAASQNSPAPAATPDTPRAYLNHTLAIPPNPPSNTPRDPLFLLICINGKAYRTLAELKCLGIDDYFNDELLVRGILELYEQARKEHQWTADLLLPTWVVPAGAIRHLKDIWKCATAPVRRLSFIQDLPPVQPISKWWSKSAFNVSPWAPLHIIDTADFVEFELVPHPEGKEAFPTHFTSGCWPPDTKQYRYRPVPMKCVKTMNLWHMRRPGPHTEVYWYNTVPKKVDGPLYRPSGTVEEVVGYGVRINERLNDVLILWWSFIFILAIGAFVYVYSHYTGDDSSAFGLGAYLVASFTVYIQLQYAWWKRT